MGKTPDVLNIKALNPNMRYIIDIFTVLSAGPRDVKEVDAFQNQSEFTSPHKSCRIELIIFSRLNASLFFSI